MQIRVLDDSPPTPDERVALFDSAATVFVARAQAGAHPDTVTVPEAPAVLVGPAFASPLLVAVAAYITVHDPDGKVPTTRTEVLDELMAHEERHWEATARAQQVDEGDDMRGLGAGRRGDVLEAIVLDDDRVREIDEGDVARHRRAGKERDSDRDRENVPE